MQELINVIRAAIATDATPDQKAAGAHACNTIAAALGTMPGNPLVLPNTPQRSPLTGVSFDQVLDLAIAKLTSIANEAQAAPTLAPQPTSALPAPTRAGLRVPTPSRAGLRVPAAQPGHTRSVPPKAAPRPAVPPRKP